MRLGRGLALVLALGPLASCTRHFPKNQNALVTPAQLTAALRTHPQQGYRNCLQLESSVALSTRASSNLYSGLPVRGLRYCDEVFPTAGAQLKEGVLDVLKNELERE